MTTSSVPSHTHPENVITAADLMAGAVLPMQVHLTVTVRPPTGKEPLDARFAPYVPALMEWAGLSPENAALLVVDLAAAFVQAGIKLSRADRQALDRHLGRPAASQVLPPGVTLTGLDVKVDDLKKGGDRG